MERKEIWVYAQCSQGHPMPVVNELIAKAREISAQIDNSLVAAVVLGDDVSGCNPGETGNSSDTLNTLKVFGADKIYCLSHRELGTYRCDVYAAAVAALAEQYHPEYLFFGATAAGSELAPSVAALLKTGLAAHCIDLRWNGERLNCIVPAFGGKVVSEIYIPNARPVMASVRPGILGGTSAKEKEDEQTGREPEVITADSSFLDQFESAEEFLGFTPSEEDAGSIEDARIVVSAGRGVSSDQSWAALNELAEKTGATIAWSRSFIDTGRVSDEKNMIGTSGKAIHADLLINVGISGATQYTCGIEKCRTIISINRDPRAKIFEHSDYGVVGDAEKIMKAVLNRI